MKTFNMYNSLDSYEQGNGKVGDVHVLLDDFAFPSDGWFDFGFYTISAWAESFSKLHGEEEKAQCKFMDGNYRLDISKKSAEIWKFGLAARLAR